MKNAVIAAIVAALVSSGATLAATSHFSGRLIKKHSLPANRLTPEAQQSLRGIPGARGPAGLPGLAGPRGLTVAVSASVIDNESASADLLTSPQTLTAACPDGEIAIGGGYTITTGTGDVVKNGSYNDDTGSGWIVEVVNSASYGGLPSLTVNVSCEPVQ